MAVATLTSKGQITLPLAVRRPLGLHPGDQIEFTEQPDGSWLLTSLGLTVDDIAGVLPVPGPAPTIEQMDAAMVAAATEGFT